MTDLLKKNVSLYVTQWSELSDGERYLLRSAREMRERSSAPYSHYAVGAAILWGNRRVSTGCNMENCTYNALHAEKCAIAVGISQYGVSNIEEIAVCGGPENDERPLITRKMAAAEFRQLASRIKFADASFSCGQCLQDILEYSYGRPENVIMLAAEDNGLILRATLDDVLPGRFGPADLGIDYNKIKER